jgi:transposase
MDDLLLLSEVQMRRIRLYFPLSHGIARVDDRRIVRAIVFVIKNGLGFRARRCATARTPSPSIGSASPSATPRGK